MNRSDGASIKAGAGRRERRGSPSDGDGNPENLRDRDGRSDGRPDEPAANQEDRHPCEPQGCSDPDLGGEAQGHEQD
jgi:hypothetical protein